MNCSTGAPARSTSAAAISRLAERNSLSGQPVRMAAAVPALPRVPDDQRDRLETGDARDHVRAPERLQAEQLEAGVGRRGSGAGRVRRHADPAHPAQPGGEPELEQVRLTGAELLGEPARDQRDLLPMPS